MIHTATDFVEGEQCATAISDLLSCSPTSILSSDHPLRAVREFVNAALCDLSGDFASLYAAAELQDNGALEIELSFDNGDDATLMARRE